MISKRFVLLFSTAMLLGVGVAHAKTFELHQHASASTLQSDCSRVGGEFHNSGGISSCMASNGNVVTCSKPDGNKCYGTTPLLAPAPFANLGESMSSGGTRHDTDSSVGKNVNIPAGGVTLGAAIQ